MKSMETATSEPLKITIDTNCHADPKELKLSVSGADGLPTQVYWQAKGACTLTIPKGLFAGWEENDLVIVFPGPSISSLQTPLAQTSPSTPVGYMITGCALSGPPDPPFIIIDN